MAKLTAKIAIPIILVGVFTIVIFIAVSGDQMGPFFYFIVLFLVVYVFFFGLMIGQNLSSPVKKLLNNATELSRGNLSSRIYLESKDEFSELARVFNEIAEELRASREQGANAEKFVGIRVKARTKELEETIDALEQKIKNRTIEIERLIEEANKLQGDVKTKGEETDQLRRELGDFKQKITKYNKPKQKEANNNI